MGLGGYQSPKLKVEKTQAAETEKGGEIANIVTRIKAFIIKPMQQLRDRHIAFQSKIGLARGVIEANTSKGIFMTRTLSLVTLALSLALLGSPARADWNFNASPTPNASIQANNMTLELQCDRLRFAPAGYEDSQDMVSKQGLSIRFLKNGSTEVGSFQTGSTNSTIRIVDNYPVEVIFSDGADYEFVLEQIAANAALNLSMVDQDISYGIFDLKGSGAAVRSLRAACATNSESSSASMEAPEGVVYCGGDGVKRQIEYVILKDPADQWDVRVTVNGETGRAMSAYSYFGNSQPPKGFVVALLGEDRSEFLIFRDGNKNWLEFGDYTYNQCN